ncbi:unnamed protein product [Caretta caretta]
MFAKPGNVQNPSKHSSSIKAFTQLAASVSLQEVEAESAGERQQLTHRGGDTTNQLMWEEEMSNTRSCEPLTQDSLQLAA